MPHAMGIDHWQVHCKKCQQLFKPEYRTQRLCLRCEYVAIPRRPALHARCI